MRFFGSAIDFDTIQSETGKARRDALAEVITVAGTARYYLKNAADHLKPTRRQAAVPVRLRRKSFISRMVSWD